MKILTLTAVTLMATTSMAMANDPMSLSTEMKTVEEQRAYDYEFNRDEQCQGYSLGIKRLGYTDPCAKDEDEEKPVVAANVLNEYVVYFDFDDASVRAEDEAVLRQAAREITNYNPREVRVAGYTDTRGSMVYNQALSANRADNVSDYLTGLGVKNYVVDEEALGETNLAVPTADEVKLQANRRVVVQFIR